MNIPEGDYDIREFCETLLETPESQVFEDLHYHQVKVFLFLTSTDDWQQFFSNYEMEDYGEVSKLTHEFRTRAGEIEEATFYAGYYQDDILMVFTGAVEDAIEQTLEATEANASGISSMPIFPPDFQEMNEYVLSQYEDIKITSFKARRQPDLVDAEIRPDVEEREIEYKADDGRQTLKEFREYYGVVPERVEYEHDELNFKMDATGKFTHSSINHRTFNLFFNLIEEVIERILDIQEVSEQIRFRTETRRSGELDIAVPRLSSGQIEFTRTFNLLMAEEFMQRISARDGAPYTFSDVNKQAGSLDLSARVTDEERNAHFNISATEDAMTIIPKRDCSWKSILKFYYYFTQTVDQYSRLRLLGRQGESQPA
jgi:hypothetical protein